MNYFGAIDFYNNYLLSKSLKVSSQIIDCTFFYNICQLFIDITIVPLCHLYYFFYYYNLSSFFLCFFYQQ